MLGKLSIEKIDLKEEVDEQSASMKFVGPME